MSEHIPVVEGLFEVEPDGGALLRAARCAGCDALHFPMPAACHCGATELVEERVGATGGVLWGWTSVNAAPPGYDGPVPYGFGVVELDEGLRVIGRITETDPDLLSFGQRMRCVVDAVGQEGGHPVVVWAFAPSET